MRAITLDEAEKKRQAAIRGLRNLGLEDKAEEIEELTAAEYAERKGFEVMSENPCFRRLAMPRKTIDDYREEIAELQEQIAELEAENDELHDRLDQIAELAAPEEEEEEVEEEADEAEEE